MPQEEGYRQFSGLRVPGHASAQPTASVLLWVADIVARFPQINALAYSLRHWKPFLDTVEALRALKERYKLAIISNVDDGLFALSACHLEVEFDWIVTAEQAGTYKPSLDNIRLALERIGVEPGRLLHVAESLFHDVVPAKELGLPTVWVHRRAGKEGFGATPPANAEPDLEVPDLKSLVAAVSSGPS